MLYGFDELMTGADGTGTLVGAPGHAADQKATIASPTVGPESLGRWQAEISNFKTV